MVQVVVDGRDLKSMRQFEDLFDIVEPVVILDDEPISDSFRKAAEILFEALTCFFFIPICVLQDIPTQYCKEKVHTFAPEIFL